ncbi:hypothetical protein BC826DRAFT_469341 [Russula brevipes]|nr:hypothetical protein BC826DRAFT_469341 [Russula brevipes]
MHARPSLPSAHLLCKFRGNKRLCIAQGMRYVRTLTSSSPVHDQNTANSIRSAKCAGDWTNSELRAYNITVVPQTKEQFFGTAKLPAPTNPSIAEFMKVNDQRDAEDEGARKLLHYLDYILNPKVGEGAVVCDFASKLLEKLGYGDGDRPGTIFMRHSFPFMICGTTLLAQPDICIMDDNEIFLLVQDDKCGFSKDPEPQVIAEAIAAFVLNNKTREKRNLQPHNRAVIPAITLTGTCPTFYKIPVTTQLSQAVQQGTYPPTETRILRFLPALPRPISLGIWPLDNRGEILACLEAFRQFVAVGPK